MDGSDEDGGGEGNQEPWQKVLWKRQPYPDNYVSPTFLKELRTKPTTSLPNLMDLMVWSLPLSQQVCLILIFVGLFLHLREQNLASETLTIGSGLVIAFCGATMPSTSINNESMAELDSKASFRTTGSNPKKVHNRALAQPLSYALLGLVILALSPLLRTLTESTTSDSIAALSTTLFLLSFALADFGVGNETVKSYDLNQEVSLNSQRRRSNSILQAVPLPHLAQGPLPATLSLNASLCASIVLASRLSSPIDAFSLILAAIGLFAFLSRWLKYHVRRRSTKKDWQPSLIVTIILLAISVTLLARFSLTAAFTNLATAVFLNILCPAWMRKAQGWKQARRGPWDMGVPRLRSR